MCGLETIAMMALSGASSANAMLKKPPAAPAPVAATAMTQAKPRKPPSTNTMLTGSKGLLSGSQNVGTNTLLGQ